MQVIEVKTILKTFDHHGKASLFIQAVENAMLAGTILAVRGGNQTLRISNVSLEYPSMAILQNEESLQWVEQTTEEINRVRYDDSKVATAKAFEGFDEQMFALFAAQAAEDLRQGKWGRFQEGQAPKSKSNKSKKTQAPDEDSNADSDQMQGTETKRPDRDEAAHQQAPQEEQAV